MFDSVTATCVCGSETTVLRSGFYDLSQKAALCGCGEFDYPTQRLFWLLDEVVKCWELVAEDERILEMPAVTAFGHYRYRENGYQWFHIKAIPFTMRDGRSFRLFFRTDSEELPEREGDLPAPLLPIPNLLLFQDRFPGTQAPLIALNQLAQSASALNQESASLDLFGGPRVESARLCGTLRTDG